MSKYKMKETKGVGWCSVCCCGNHKLKWSSSSRLFFYVPTPPHTLIPCRSDGDTTKTLPHKGKDSRSNEKQRLFVDEGKSSKGLLHVSISAATFFHILTSSEFKGVQHVQCMLKSFVIDCMVFCL